MSSRGAAGATKPKLHNVNSIYAGKNHNAVKAPGLGKHGLQSLGKTTAVVRRMPPPATLPSLRAESQGQDPNVALVPQGGTGWNKNTSVDNTNLSDSTSILKSGGSVSGSGTSIIGSQSVGQHTTDLRPTWAKPASSSDFNATATQNSTAVTASARDFPSLAAATASAGKQSSALLNDSLKPQKSGSWRAGGGSAQSKNEGEDAVVPSHPRSAGNLSYPAITAPSRTTERQLPSRYYDGAAVYSSSNGTYQIPKSASTAMTSTMTQPNAENRFALQEENSIRTQQALLTQQPATNAVVFPANVAIPPPNYSQPPPNFQPLQAEPVRKVLYTASQTLSQASTGSGNLDVEEAQEVSQKNGPGEGGYREEVAKTMPMNIASNQTFSYAAQNDDVERLPSEIAEKQEKGFLATDRHGVPMEDVDWPSSQYGYIDREAESRRWRSAGGGGQDSGPSSSENAQFHYGREREDDFGRRENVEREAAIERSRRKRRTLNQNSVPSESESGASSAYGSTRAVGGFDNEVYSEWDRTARQNSYSQASNEGGIYCGEKVNKSQHWGMSYGEAEASDDKRELRKQDDLDSASKLGEYKVLRRPESQESAGISQQISQMSLQQDEAEDEEDELQLTKLAHVTTKVVKRVAPSANAVQQPEPVRSNANQNNVPVVSQSVSVLASQRPQYSHSKASTDKRKIESSVKRPETVPDTSSQKITERDKKLRNSKETRLVEDQEAVAAKQVSPPTIVAAPPPPDNVWEKRAEEREVAQRAAKKDYFDNHFPAFNDETNSGDFGKHSKDSNQPNSFMRKDGSRSEVAVHKQRGSKRRNQNWLDNGYSGNYAQFDSGDFYGQDDEEDNGQLFRGQREFVNSRVSAHHRSRGGSLFGNRESKGRNAVTGLRRGASVPHQTSLRGRRMQLHYGERGEKYNQRRNRRQEDQILEQEDNFANMGEFRVEDTYPSLATADEKQPIEELKKDTQEASEIGKKANGERRSIRTQRSFGQRTQQQYRSTQQYYQPRPQNEEYNARTGGRGNNRKRGTMRRVELYNAGSSQNFSERGKKKKDYLIKRDEVRDKNVDDENSFVSSFGEDNSKERKRNSVQQTRFRRTSPTREDNLSNAQQSTLTDRISHVKSPVTSEGQEEWETASESSDVGERQKAQKRNMASAKFSGARRVRRTANGQRRENVGETTAARTTHSKNAKPASTTLHAAVRGGQSHGQESGQVTSSEPHRREVACRDGLAGLDINDAGVVVIDDLRDTENYSGDPADDGDDDFEEVISKKSKRIRQQQINEQLEAERRKLKEKEKEKRKTRQQMKKTDKKIPNAKEVKPVNISSGGVGRTTTESQNSGLITTGVPKTPPTMLNTTVWNSSMVKEQGLPPLDNHPVIPSPIARPVHKTGISTSSSNMTTVQKTVEAWTRPDEEQRQTTSKKLDDSLSSSSAKKTTVEFAANFNSPPTRPESSQYDFTFDPSLQDDSQPLSPKSPTKNISVNGDHMESSGLKGLSVEQNDNERLRERLDKVKDFWQGQQFTNSLLENAVGASSISQLNEKPQSASGTASIHGPNVAKVRPQPQTNESCGGSSLPLKDCVSTSSAVSVLPPPSPVACLPPGTYLQSLTQVPPPAAHPHYSMIFGDPFSLHSATSPPAQAVFNGGVSSTQGPTSRSRPASYIEPSQLFIHPPPSGSSSNNLTWSNPAPQLEILSGITPTASLSSQSRPTSVQRFQFPSQAPSGSTFGTPPPVMNGAAKLSHIAPPPHPHQVPPPLHPSHSFMPPHPQDFFPHQGSALGPVGSQRGTAVTSQGGTSAGIARNNVSILGQVPPPHMQHINFQPQSPSAFGLPGASTFSQVPQLHAFTAPPPPLRYPSVQSLNNDVNGLAAAGWSKSAVTSVSMKFANGGCGPNVVPLERNGGRNLAERWAMPASLPQYQNNFVYQQQTFGKDTSEGIQSNSEHYSSHCSAEPRRETAEERASTASSISANGSEVVDSSKKTAAKV